MSSTLLILTAPSKPAWELMSQDRKGASFLHKHPLLPRHSMCDVPADSRLAQLSHAMKALSPTARALPEAGPARLDTTDAASPGDATQQPTGHSGQANSAHADAKIHAGRSRLDDSDLLHKAPAASPFQELQQTASSSSQALHAESEGPARSSAAAANADQDATSNGANTSRPNSASGSRLHQRPNADEAGDDRQMTPSNLPGQQVTGCREQDAAPSSPMSVREGPVRSRRPSHAGPEPLASFSRVDTAD